MKQILIIGTGGAGCNIINDLQITKQKTIYPKGANFTFDNTKLNSPNIHFLGLDNSQNVHKEEPWFISTEQDLSTILLDVLNGIESIFIICGIRGKTGGHLAKEIEQYAANNNIQPVLVAIYPFCFEGEGNTKQTTQYFESRSLDIIKISNDDYGNAPLRSLLKFSYNLSMVGIYLYANIRQLHNKSEENCSFLHFCCAIGNFLKFYSQSRYDSID